MLLQIENKGPKADLWKNLFAPHAKINYKNRNPWKHPERIKSEMQPTQKTETEREHQNWRQRHQPAGVARVRNTSQFSVLKRLKTARILLYNVETLGVYSSGGSDSAADSFLQSQNNELKYTEELVSRETVEFGHNYLCVCHCEGPCIH